MRWIPITGFAVERVRFDMQMLMNPEISGIEYQQGELQGYEVREYLLEKHGRTCAYCDKSGVGPNSVPLEIEHIIPKSKGGSDRVSNLTLACRPCNQAKGSEDLKVFLKKDPERADRILANARRPLRDAAAVNVTRFAIVKALKAFALPVEVSTGGRTKWNRPRFEVPKTHANDAACVGVVDGLFGWEIPTLRITAMGRGLRQRALSDAYGFPVSHRGVRSVRGFRTGDIVKADVPGGVNKGVHFGRVAIRKTGSLNVRTSTRTIQGIRWRHCRHFQRGDGYAYDRVAVDRQKKHSSPA